MSAFAKKTVSESSPTVGGGYLFEGDAVSAAFSEVETGRLQIRALRQRLELLESEKSALLRSGTSVATDFEMLRGIESVLRDRCATLQNEVKRLTSELAEREKRLAESEAQFKKELNEARTAEAELRKRTSELESELARELALREELAKEARRNGTLSARAIEESRARERAAREESSVVCAELERLRADRAQTKLKLEAESDRRAREARVSAEAIARLSRQVAEQEREIRGLRDRERDGGEALSRLKTSDRLRAEEHSRALAEISRLNELARDRSNAISAATAEIARLNERIAVKDERIDAEWRNLREREAELARRENEVRRYCDSLTVEKGRIRKASKQLAGELEEAGSLHPLRDYLALTEFEIGKVELQLAKTPASSIDRPRLETALSKLSEQRQFLKSVIDASLAQMSERASKLNRLSQAERLDPVPPPPPSLSRKRHPSGS